MVNQRPTMHAINFIGSLRELELEDFVSPYYSVQMFKATYASWVGPLPDKSQWRKVHLRFKLKPPLLKRVASRLRTRRIRGVENGGSTKMRVKCKRCGGFGHLMKTCNETIVDPDAPPPAPRSQSVSTPPRQVAAQDKNKSPGPLTR